MTATPLAQIAQEPGLRQAPRCETPTLSEPLRAAWVLRVLPSHQQALHLWLTDPLSPATAGQCRAEEIAPGPALKALHWDLRQLQRSLADHHRLSQGPAIRHFSLVSQALYLAEQLLNHAVVSLVD